MMSEIEETAKATQEVAKTVSNALDKSEKFGGFITKYFGTTMEQSIGIFNDKLKYWRWENQVNLISKANEKMKKLGIDTPSKQIPLKLGLPLIEAASLEDDSELQELWANLLVNSSIDTGFSLERSYISVLEQFSLLETQILVKIYSNYSYDINTLYRIMTYDLPDNLLVIKGETEIIIDTKKLVDWDWTDTKGFLGILKDKPINEDIHLSLANLIRLGCIIPSVEFIADTSFRTVHPTIFGKKLYEAVKEPNIK